MAVLMSHGHREHTNIPKLYICNIDFKIKCLATKGGFGQSAYLADHLYEFHGLDEKSLVTATKDFLKN